MFGRRRKDSFRTGKENSTGEEVDVGRREDVVVGRREDVADCGGRECTPTKEDTLCCSNSTPISSKLKRNSSKKIKEVLRKKGKAVGRTLIDSCDKAKEKVDEFLAATPTKEH
nr:hypothetical protein [Tanacetum cinerariifolium]